MEAKHSFWVEFLNDRSVLVEEGQTILQASLQAGIPHYHACGGKGKCSTCRVMVLDGQELLSPYSAREAALRRLVPIPPDVRLACQTFVTGTPVRLHRLIRDDTDVDILIRQDIEAGGENHGEERDLVLFFLDIRNFTPFLERYLPFDVIHMLRRLYALFRSNIEKNRGNIIETAGDGFYAVFGLMEGPEAASNHAYASGKGILGDLEVFNDQYAERHFLHRFQAGIGLHAGRVIVGNIGIGVNNNLTVMGLPVNIAARIQGATRTVNNNFLVSEAVFRQLSHPPEVEKRALHLKGIRNAIPAYLCGRPFD